VGEAVFGQRMRFYTIHENPARRNEDDRVVLVREGFSFGGFFIPVLWALYRRAWIVLPVYAALAGLVMVLLVMFGAGRWTLEYAMGALGIGMPVLLVAHPHPAIAALAALIAALMGFEANDLRRFMLARRGYRVVDVVAAPSLVEAERAYFGAKGFPAAEAPPAAQHASFSDSFGPPRRRTLSIIPGLDDRP
jgi:hypothetical protein